MLFSAPNKMPAVPESPKLCSYTCGAQCKGRACPAISCRTRKSDGSFFLKIVTLTPFWGTADLPHLFVSLLYRMLCHKGLDPSQNEAGCLQSQHTGAMAKQFPERSWLLPRGGILSSGGRTGAQETSLLIFDAKSLVKLRGQEARLLCVTLLPRPWVWGRDFFSGLWSISSSRGQNFLSVKKIPQSG